MNVYVECEYRCGIGNVEWRMCNGECGMGSVKWRMWNGECEIGNMKWKYRMWNGL